MSLTYILKVTFGSDKSTATSSDDYLKRFLAIHHETRASAVDGIFSIFFFFLLGYLTKSV